MVDESTFPQALNWLLRSVTQPTCVHDVMWWFCDSLDKFARLVPPPADDLKEVNIIVK